MKPLLKLFFTISYVLLAPFVGPFADSMPKGKVMFITNAIKVFGCGLMFFSVHPLLAYAVVGLGAAAYSPAKYGILTELLPPEKLVAANGWIEGTTVGSIILGTVLGGLLISPKISSALLSFDMPVLETGIDTPAESAIIVIAGSRGAVGQFPSGGFGGGAFPEGGFIARFGLVQAPPPLRADPAIDPSGLRDEAKYFRLNSLKTVAVPIPSDIGLYIKDQRAAIALGKAFFWEQQAGSDGMACASCHFHAGVDRRTKHQISPGILGGNGKFDPLPSGTSSGGVNYQLKR
jgi:MFS family permease